MARMQTCTHRGHVSEHPRAVGLDRLEVRGCEEEINDLVVQLLLELGGTRSGLKVDKERPVQDP